MLSAFPRYLHFLPDRVRFPEKPDSTGTFVRQVSPEITPELAEHRRVEALKFRSPLLLSGTLRVFVQSAIMPVAALLMHDAQWTGQFRQSIAVATLYLLQLPFEALASRMCCVCSARAPSKNDSNSADSNTADSSSAKIISAGLFVVLALASFPIMSNARLDLQLLQHMFELAGLVVMLAVAAPLNASRLYQLRDAERTIVTLEWLKAYIGRLLGPFAAVVVYTQVGYSALLAALSAATFAVVLTA